MCDECGMWRKQVLASGGMTAPGPWLDESAQGAVPFVTADRLKLFYGRSAEHSHKWPPRREERSGGV